MVTALQDTRSILAELIAFPTVSSESNRDLVGYLERKFRKLGARVDIWSDETGAKANLFATLGPSVHGGIVLSGHTDVVPVTDQIWSTDPFTLEDRDGRWYGRGACDMKGFVAAAVVMAKRYAKLNLTRPVHFAFTHDEEVGCLGARALAEKLRNLDLKPSQAIIGEPTSMQVIQGHKGCYEYTTHFTGCEGHGSAPDRGVNAVEYAVRYGARLLELKAALVDRAPETSQFDPPWTTINTGGLVGGVAHNVIPGQARLDWEMRPVQASDAEFVKENLRRYCTDSLIPEMRSAYPLANISTEIIGEVDGLEPTPVNTARDLLMELTGANRADLVPFGTEGGIFQNLGLDVAICGPGSIDQAHKPDEFVCIDQIDQCLRMLELLGDKLTLPTEN